MPRGLVIVLAAVLVAGVATVEGLRSNRWGPTEDMRTAAARLDAVPRDFGDWVGTDAQMDRKILEVAEATGNVSRTYKNRKNGDTLSVLLLCGPSGPIGAHTPDVCYGGLGFKCVGKPRPTRVTLANGEAAFWAARFEKETSAGEALRVYWAWGTDGNWEASSDPRTEFALHNVLYKVYVVHPSPKPDSRDPTAEFLAEFLPVVKTALTPNAG